jgi:hypothetical protein
MNFKEPFQWAYALGLALVLWVAATAALSNPLVLVMTLVIGAVFTWGMQELRQHRQHIVAFRSALLSLPEPSTPLSPWLEQLPSAWGQIVGLRIAGIKATPPVPAMTPYLVGLLVMLGMLGTFLGMVLTLSGTAFALQNLTDIQGIRAAFSEPIKGLGLAFGASVAGVGTSAMLGFMNSWVRKERALAWRELEGLLATSLRGHTSEQRREQSLQAMEQHLQTLPGLVVRLGEWMDRLDIQQQSSHQHLQNRQEAFQVEARQQHVAWVESLDLKLREQLSFTLGQTADQLQEMSRAVLNRLEQQGQTLHEQFAGLHQSHLQQQMQHMQQWRAQIESVLNQQLGQIGSSLQGPLANLTDLTSQATQAATELMHQMQQVLQDHSGRDHALLQERSVLMGQLSQTTQLLEQHIGQLKHTLGQEMSQLSQNLTSQSTQMSQALRQDMASLSHQWNEQAQNLSQSFAQHSQHLVQRLEQQVDHQSQRSQALDEQLQVGAIEIQSLANAFASAVQALLDGQQKTLDRLQHTEQTMAQSMARSDEQLAYYVAQAKEVIELSLSAQQPMLQALERASQQAARAERA